MSVEPNRSFEVASGLPTDQGPSTIEPDFDACGSAKTNTATEITEREIQEKPWKYVGYKGYARFIASDDDLYVIRRFSSLNARVALALQDQLSVMEENLDTLDREYSRRDARDIHNGSFRGDQNDRKEIIDAITQKLKEYNEFIMLQTQLRKYKSVPKSDIRNIQTWHENHGSYAISGEEQAYLKHIEDLIFVSHKEKTPLRRLFDRSEWLRTHSIWKKERALASYDQGTIDYFSDNRIDRFITVLIVAGGMVMLIAPMWILQALQRPFHKIAVINVFIFIFLALVTYATPAKSFETLGATAAYSTVLMVFLQLGTTNP